MKGLICVFDNVDIDDEDENVVDALQQNFERSVLPTLRDDGHEAPHGCIVARAPDALIGNRFPLLVAAPMSTQ